MPVLSRPFAAPQPEQLEGVSTYGEAFGASMDEAISTGPTASAWNALKAWGSDALGFDAELFPSMGPQAGNPLAGFGGRARTVSPEDAQQRVKDAGVEGRVPLQKYPEGIANNTLDLLIGLNQEAQKRETLMGQYQGWSPQLAGLLVGSLVDPINVASAFIPVVGETRYAKLIAQAGGTFERFGIRSGVGALEGLTGAAVAEPFIYAGQQQTRNDYDAYDSMLNIAGGAVFGSLLHAGVGLVRDSFGNPASVEFGTPPAENADIAPDMAVDVSPTVPMARREAFHGTPSSVDRFSLDRIGSGEGQQVFGWGLYFAQTKDVAERYRIALTGLDRVPGVKAAEEMLVKTGGDRVEAVRLLKRKGDEAAANFLRRDMNRGNTYRVEIPSDENLLDWDKPIGEQSDAVRKLSGEPGETGAQLYRRMSDELGAKGASEALLRQGIPGLRYLDGDSRSLGQGTYNYVIWDEASIGTPESADPLAPTLAQRAFVASLDQSTQAAALRQAVTQAVSGQPIEVTPAMLADPQFASSPEAYRDAVNRANLNATKVDGANTRAANEVEARLGESEPDPLTFAKEQLADEQARVKAAGGEPEPVEDDLQITQKAVKAATMCLMRANG